MSSQTNTYSLGDITTLITDGKHGDCKNEKDSGYYFLSVKDITEDRLNYKKARQIKKIDFDETDKRTNLQPEDILFTNTGTIGRMAIAPDNELTRKTTFQKSVAIIKPKKDVVFPKYLFYLLKKENKRLCMFAEGTTQKNLLLKDLRSFPIGKIPELDYQKAIAHVLGTLDTKIELNKKTHETLEEIAKTLFKSWFIDFNPVKAKSEGRSTGLPDEISALFPDSFEDSELGEIPKGWSCGEIQDLCEWVSSGGTPSRSNKEYWNNGNISWFKTGELKDSLLFDSLENINELAIKNSSCKLWEKGTILFAIYASPTVGKLGVLTKDGTCNQAAAGLKAKEEIGTAFLRRCLLFSRKKLQNIAVGAAQQNINVQILKQHQIIIPNDNLPSLYSSLVLSLDSKQEVILREILYLEELRDTLLSKLISGELRISDAEKIIGEALI